MNEDLRGQKLLTLVNDSIAIIMLVGRAKHGTDATGVLKMIQTDFCICQALYMSSESES